MLVLPIINRNRILNVEVNLKNAVKVSDEFYTKDIRPSDIVVNGNSYYEYLNLKHLTTSTTSSVMEFVRLSSKSGTKSILVSTKTDDNNKYDVYRITKITDKISDGFDSLIGTLILDLKNRTPNQKNRYLDLKKLQVFDIISESSLEKIEYASANLERLNISKYISDNNLDLITFIEEYKNDNNKIYKTEKEKLIMKVKNKTLYIDKKTNKPIKMEIQDANKNIAVYILYREVSFKN